MSEGLPVTVSDDDASTEAQAAPDAHGLGRGSALGRYIVIERLGQGGMGVVYAAYDPDLDRKLAIKLLRAEPGQGATAARRARLLREAQALARLDHPNVVAVYDVGTLGDQIFVAMELIAGKTATAWLAERPRELRAIVDVYIQAGRGLAAAHRLGIVHRDFKPDNVLILADGRACVVDFGLARGTEDGAEPSGVAGDEPPASLDEPLTKTGALVGTPGYIAPEQQRGRTLPAVDQFSFCSALWKALYGQLPFAGTTASELADAAARGELREVPRRSGVPARLHRVLVRGLAAQPERRFASMDDLLAALTRDRARRNRGIAAAVAGIAAVAGAIALVATRREPTQVCRGADRELAGVWDQGRRGALDAAFAATRVPYAGLAASGVASVLDRYAAAWTDMRTDACEATHVRGEQSEDLLDLRMACLDDRARDLRALGDVLVHADAKAVEKSLAAAQALPAIDACADLAALKAPVKLPVNPVIRARLAVLGTELAAARALDAAGKFADAIARAKPVADEARALGYRPLQARSLDVLGGAQRDAGDLPGAQTSLEAAVVAAIAAHDDVSGADAAAVLVRVVGYDRAKPDDSPPWIARAEAFLEAQPDDRVQALLENNRGVVAFGAGHYDDALAHHTPALALRVRVFGPNSPIVAATLDNIGLDHDFKGDNTTGIDFHKRALAIDLEALGPMHPTVALTLTNLAVSLRQAGLYDEALDTANRALAIKERAYGPDSNMVAISLNEIGNIHFFKHEYAEALDVFRRSLEIKKKAVGPDHPLVGGTYGNMANCLAHLGRLDEARTYALQGIAIKEKALGPAHADLGHEYTVLGEIAIARKQYDEARASYGHALAIWQKAVDADSPLIASAEGGLGDVELAAGNAKAAIAHYNAALAIRMAKPVDVADRAETDLSLAKAYWADGEHDKARPLAEAAVDQYRQAGARGDDGRKDAEAWLAAHR